MPKLLTATLSANASVSGLGKSFCPEQPVCRIRRPVPAYTGTTSAFFLLSQSKSLDQGTISLNILILQIIQHTSSLSNHLQKSSSGVMVLGIVLQMLGQLSDPFGKDSDLNLR